MDFNWRSFPSPPQSRECTHRTLNPHLSCAPQQSESLKKPRSCPDKGTNQTPTAILIHPGICFLSDEGRQDSTG